MPIKNKIINLLRGNPVSVGLDIGNHSVKIVRIAHLATGPLLQGVGIHVLKPETIINGEIKDKDDLLNSLTTLSHKTDPSQKIHNINLGLSWSYGVIADRISLRSTGSDSDEELILMEASRHPPFDVEDIQLDYKILQRNESTNNMEVLLVAAKLRMMQPYLQLIREAALSPINVDVDTFAVTNAFLFSASEEDLNKVVALVNIGDTVTNLTFLKNGNYHSTREIGTAGSFFIQTLEKNLQIETLEATALLKGGKLAESNQETVLRSIEYAAEELSVGIDLAFSYFQSSEGNANIDKMILSGGGACIPHLPDLLAERHDMEVEIADPLGNIAYDKKKFSSPIPQDISTILTVATGLALRKF